MSSQAATKFLDRLATDGTLRESLMSGGESKEERMAAIVAAGGQHGFEFTPDDIVGALKASSRGGELSEGELEQVAGGGLRSFGNKIANWLGVGSSTVDTTGGHGGVRA